MFYSNELNGDNDLNNTFNNTYIGEDLSKSSSYVAQGIDEILKNYDNHEVRVKELVNDFREDSTFGLENQILDLFNNVKNLLVNGDRSLIKISIESISQGKENALRFIEEQGEFMDSKTLNIMHSIVNEYSYHINYLNQAMNILGN